MASDGSADGIDQLIRIDSQSARRSQQHIWWPCKVAQDRRCRPQLKYHLDQSLPSWREYAQTTLKNSVGRSIYTDTDQDQERGRDD